MGLEQDSLEQLFMKRKILDQIILEGANDDRVGEPKRQLVIINAEINRRQNKEEMPPDLAVGLKSLNLEVKQK